MGGWWVDWLDAWMESGKVSLLLDGPNCTSFISLAANPPSAQASCRSRIGGKRKNENQAQDLRYEGMKPSKACPAMLRLLETLGTTHSSSGIRGFCFLFLLLFFHSLLSHHHLALGVSLSVLRMYSVLRTYSTVRSIAGSRKGCAFTLGFPKKSVRLPLCISFR